MEFIPPWLVPLATALTAGLTIWNFVQSPSKKNAEAITKLADDNADAITKLAEALTRLGDKLSDRLDGVEKRTATLEDAYRHLPDKESIHRLELNMERISGAMSTMGAQMDAVREISVMTRDMVAKDVA